MKCLLRLVDKMFLCGLCVICNLCNAVHTWETFVIISNTCALIMHPEHSSSELRCAGFEIEDD